MCQGALCASVFMSQRVLHAYALTCQRVLRPYVLMCQPVLCAYVLCSDFKQQKQVFNDMFSLDLK